MDEQFESGAALSSDTASSIPVYPPEIEALTLQLLGQIADKWTMIVLEELTEHGTLRFTELRKKIPGISQKMLTQTLRQMERIGLVVRTVHPVIPPKVEYQRTDLGQSLGPVVCQLWDWVADNAKTMDEARKNFERASTRAG
jgi:DNA-binding HxlR family transcriptional regulator